MCYMCTPRGAIATSHEPTTRWLAFSNWPINEPYKLVRMTFQASARTRCSSIQIFDDLHGHLPLFRCLALYAICTATTEEMTVRRKKTMLLDRQKSAAVLRLLRGLASAGTKLAALADALSANSTVQSSSLNFNRIQTPSIPHVSGCTNILAPTRTRLLRWPRLQRRRAHQLCPHCARVGREGGPLLQH